MELAVRKEFTMEKLKGEFGSRRMFLAKMTTIHNGSSVLL